MSASEGDISSVIEAILTEEVVTGAMLCQYLNSTGLNKSQQARLMGLTNKSLRFLERGIHQPRAKTVANVRYMIQHPDEVIAVLNVPTKEIGPITQAAPNKIPIGLIPSENGYWGYCKAADCRKRVYFTNTRQKWCSKRCNIRVSRGLTYEIGQVRRPPRDANFRQRIISCPHCGTEFAERGNFVRFGPPLAEGQANDDSKVEVERQEPGLSPELLLRPAIGFQPDHEIRVSVSDPGGSFIPITEPESLGPIADDETGRQ